MMQVWFFGVIVLALPSLAFAAFLAYLGAFLLLISRFSLAPSLTVFFVERLEAFLAIQNTNAELT